jgi:peptidoglycan/LPS O-acetylase OafA/YrhL
VPYPDSLPRALPFVWLFFVGNLFYLYREWFFRFRYLGFPILALAIGVHLYGIVIGNLIHLDCLASVLTAPGILLIGTQFVPKLPRMPDFSYSCYIWHYLIGSWCISVGLSKWMLIPFLAIACAGSWYLIEKPSRKWRHRRPQLAFWKTPEPAEVAV